MSSQTDWRPAIGIVAAALAFRIVSALVGGFVVLTFPAPRADAITMWGEPSPFWDQFTRYDAGWYYQVARYGYRFVEGGPPVGLGKPGKIAYFPAYPLATRYASRLFGHSAGAIYLGGIAVSWIAFAVAMVVLLHLARLDLPPPEAERAVLLTAIFPFAFFFGFVYTESLFLLASLTTFYAFRTRRWVAGGLAGAVATATRVNGLMMLPALAWIAWRTAPPTTRDRALAAAGLGLTLVGIAGYSLFVYQLTGQPFEWAASISRWGYHPGGVPWLAPVRLVQRLITHPYVYLTTDPMAPYDTLYGLSGIAFLAAIPFVWLRFGAAYGLFMLANLWLPLSSGVFEGVGRYCSVLFPCFFWLASRRSAALQIALVVGFAIFYALSLALFVTNHPIF